jgi:hypothetical protein
MIKLSVQCGRLKIALSIPVAAILTLLAILL